MSDLSVVITALELGLAVAALFLFARAALRNIIEKLNWPN